jgi:hypothetical protein
LYKTLARQLHDQMAEAVETFGIPAGLWHPGDTALSLTKIGSRIPLSQAATGSFEEEASQVVLILTSEPDDPLRKSKPLVEHEFALMKLLRLYAIRLFVHLPDDDEAVRSKIEGFFRTELPDFPHVVLCRPVPVYERPTFSLCPMCPIRRRVKTAANQIFSGSGGRIRTADARIMIPLL